jgi:TRAP-type C4-dicarboxylate transport system permease small subunit
VLGSPLVLLASLLLSFSIRGWVAYLLVAGFVGGFLYLVVQMPREPRDPGDDGAQV